MTRQESVELAVARAHGLLPSANAEAAARAEEVRRLVARRTLLRSQARELDGRALGVVEDVRRVRAIVDRLPPRPPPSSPLTPLDAADAAGVADEDAVRAAREEATAAGLALAAVRARVRAAEAERRKVQEEVDWLAEILAKKGDKGMLVVDRVAARLRCQRRGLQLEGRACRTFRGRCLFVLRGLHPRRAAVLADASTLCSTPRRPGLQEGLSPATAVAKLGAFGFTGDAGVAKEASGTNEVHDLTCGESDWSTDDSEVSAAESQRGVGFGSDDGESRNMEIFDKVGDAVQVRSPSRRSGGLARTAAGRVSWQGRKAGTVRGLLKERIGLLKAVLGDEGAKRRAASEDAEAATITRKQAEAAVAAAVEIAEALRLRIGDAKAEAEIRRLLASPLEPAMLRGRHTAAGGGSSAESPSPHKIFELFGLINFDGEGSGGGFCDSGELSRWRWERTVAASERAELAGRVRRLRGDAQEAARGRQSAATICDALARLLENTVPTGHNDAETTDAWHEGAYGVPARAKSAAPWSVAAQVGVLTPTLSGTRPTTLRDSMVPTRVIGARRDLDTSRASREGLEAAVTATSSTSVLLCRVLGGIKGVAEFDLLGAEAKALGARCDVHRLGLASSVEEASRRRMAARERLAAVETRTREMELRLWVRADALQVKYSLLNPPPSLLSPTSGRLEDFHAAALACRQDTLRADRHARAEVNSAVHRLSGELDVVARRTRRGRWAPLAERELAASRAVSLVSAAMVWSADAGLDKLL